LQKGKKVKVLLHTYIDAMLNKSAVSVSQNSISNDQWPERGMNAYLVLNDIVLYGNPYLILIDVFRAVPKTYDNLANRIYYIESKNNLSRGVDYSDDWNNEQYFRPQSFAKSVQKCFVPKLNPTRRLHDDLVQQNQAKTRFESFPVRSINS
jgi:hypothetical protein